MSDVPGLASRSTRRRKAKGKRKRTIISSFCFNIEKLVVGSVLAKFDCNLKTKFGSILIFKLKHRQLLGNAGHFGFFWRFLATLAKSSPNLSHFVCFVFIWCLFCYFVLLFWFALFAAFFMGIQFISIYEVEFFLVNRKGPSSLLKVFPLALLCIFYRLSFQQLLYWPLLRSTVTRNI